MVGGKKLAETISLMGTSNLTSVFLINIDSHGQARGNLYLRFTSLEGARRGERVTKYKYQGGKVDKQ